MHYFGSHNSYSEYVYLRLKHINFFECFTNNIMIAFDILFIFGYFKDRDCVSSLHTFACFIITFIFHYDSEKILTLLFTPPTAEANNPASCRHNLTTLCFKCVLHSFSLLPCRSGMMQKQPGNEDWLKHIGLHL